MGDVKMWTCEECSETVPMQRKGVHIGRHRMKANAEARAKEQAIERPGPPPSGFRWVFNRLGRYYEDMFDHVVYGFGPHEFKLLPATPENDVAGYLANNSIFQIEPTLVALVMNDEPGYGEHLEETESRELYDRRNNPNPAGRGLGGLKTTPTLVPVPGADQKATVYRR
jgi:hypothetical protein